MTFENWVKTYIGKGVDFDGACGVQCVDVAKNFAYNVLGLKFGAWGNAHSYYDDFNNYSTLTNNFTRIANTPSFVPKRGDIVVWSSKMSSGGWGHIAVATGEGDTSYFFSYDQNWTGNHDKMAKIKHNYNFVLGVLRAKDQSKICGVSGISVAKETAKYKVIKTTHFRHEPDFSSKSVNVLKKGRKINVVRGYTVDSEGAIWCKVILNKKTYYVPHAHIQKI